MKGTYVNLLKDSLTLLQPTCNHCGRSFDAKELEAFRDLDGHVTVICYDCLDVTHTLCSDCGLLGRIDEDIVMDWGEYVIDPVDLCDDCIRIRKEGLK